MSDNERQHHRGGPRGGASTFALAVFSPLERQRHSAARARPRFYCLALALPALPALPRRASDVCRFRLGAAGRARRRGRARPLDARAADVRRSARSGGALPLGWQTMTRAGAGARPRARKLTHRLHPRALLHCPPDCNVARRRLAGIQALRPAPRGAILMGQGVYAYACRALEFHDYYLCLASKRSEVVRSGCFTELAAVCRRSVSFSRAPPGAPLIRS